MSYDVSIEYHYQAEEVGDMTSNVADMWNNALGCTLGSLNGWQCSEAEPVLRKGIREMEKRRDAYTALAPENGWGDYDGALDYLRRIAASCVRHPCGVLRISC